MKSLAISGGKLSLFLAIFTYRGLPFTIAIDSNTVEEMDQADYRPAKIEELLALGAAKPGLQREFPIVELGSIWVGRDGRRRVNVHKHFTRRFCVKN